MTRRKPDKPRSKKTDEERASIRIARRQATITKFAKLRAEEAKR